MITSDQRKVLEILLIRYLGSNPTSALVEPFVGPEAALDIRVASTVRQTAQWVVDRLLAAETPERLIGTIHKLDDETAAVGSLADLANALEADPSAWHSRRENVDFTLEGDPLDVIDGRPFVDRSAFRQLIPRPGALDTPACTLVLGEFGDGKSYLKDFCRGLAHDWSRRRQGTLRVGYTECPTSSPGDLSLEVPAIEVATELRTRFDTLPRPHEDAHRWAGNLASWLLAYTPEGPLPALAIFDGFDHVDVPPAVHTLIRELIRGIQEDPGAYARLRVVLLGYNSGLLEDAALQYETCVLEYVDADHIDGWLRKKYPGHAKYRYRDTAENIAGRLTPGSTRMRLMCSLMQAASAEFRERR